MNRKHLQRASRASLAQASVNATDNQDGQRGSLPIVAIAIVVTLGVASLMLSKSYQSSSSSRVEQHAGTSSFNTASTGAQLVMSELRDQCTQIGQAGVNPGLLESATATDSSVCPGGKDYVVSRTINGIPFTVKFSLIRDPDLGDTDPQQCKTYVTQSMESSSGGAASQAARRVIELGNLACSFTHPIVGLDALAMGPGSTINNNPITNCETTALRDYSHDFARSGWFLPGLARLPDFPGLPGLFTPAHAAKPSGTTEPATPIGGGHTPVTICHKPGTPAQKTLVVDDDALAAHLRHGDIQLATGSQCPVAIVDDGTSFCGGTPTRSTACNLFTSAGKAMPDAITVTQQDTFPSLNVPQDAFDSNGITVGTNASSSIASGNYGTIAMGSGASLTFGSGTDVVFNVNALISSSACLPASCVGIPKVGEDPGKTPQGQGGGKGLLAQLASPICHKPNSVATKTMYIDSGEARQAHIDHGDTPDVACPVNTVVSDCTTIGSNGSTNVTSGKTIIMAPGTYHINDISLDDNITFKLPDNVSGTVILHVRDVNLGRSVSINAGGKPGQFVIYVHGNLVISSNATIAAVIASPFESSTMVIGDYLNLNGAILSAGGVLIGNGATVAFDDSIWQTMDPLQVMISGSSNGGYRILGRWSETMVR